MADTKASKSDSALLVILACGATVDQAAKQTGISERTVYRRLADPLFKQQLHSMRFDMVQRTSGTLTASGSEAVKTLLALMRPEVPASVRLGASRAVLELGIKVREIADLDQRLTEVESQFGRLGDLPTGAES